MNREPRNAFTVDVEDYFQVEGLAHAVHRDDWNGYPLRVERNTHRILDLLDTRAVHGTFFTLGWVAERLPGLVREIAGRGHEIASHGWSHRLIYRQARDEFRAETLRSKALLEDQCQRPVEGYRAATYSITRESLWALDILCEAGFRYDSSIFPMRHDRYGIPDAPLDPYRLQAPGGGSLIEFPISVFRRGAFTLPVAGGGYFRLFPYALTRFGLSAINREGRSFVFYLHPWEVDPDQPEIAGTRRLNRFRHRVNLARTQPRLERLLTDFRFTTMRQCLLSTGLMTAA